MKQPANRRELLKYSATSVVTSVFSHKLAGAESQTKPNKLILCLFSKPLQNRPFKDLPPLVNEFGFHAVDLTCRAGGHVLPERVADDLPMAYEQFKAAGISIPMITTGIIDADKDHAEDVLKTASSLGIKYAKLGYYVYGDLHNIHSTLADVKARVRDVAALCKQYHIQAGFHNHSGQTVGSAMWDIWHFIRDLPPETIGSYYDGGHATVEGGDGGWQIALNLLASRIVMMAVKDFYWEKDPKAGWQPKWGPLGDGMVRWEDIFRRMKEQKFTGPISMHMEYREQGPVGSDADKAILAAIRHDAPVVREWLKRTELA